MEIGQCVSAIVFLFAKLRVPECRGLRSAQVGAPVQFCLALPDPAVDVQARSPRKTGGVFDVNVVSHVLLGECLLCLGLVADCQEQPVGEIKARELTKHAKLTTPLLRHGAVEEVVLAKLAHGGHDALHAIHCLDQTEHDGIHRFHFHVAHQRQIRIGNMVWLEQSTYVIILRKEDVLASLLVDVVLQQLLVFRRWRRWRQAMGLPRQALFRVEGTDAHGQRQVYAKDRQGSGQGTQEVPECGVFVLIQPERECQRSHLAAPIRVPIDCSPLQYLERGKRKDEIRSEGLAAVPRLFHVVARERRTQHARLRFRGPNQRTQLLEVRRHFV
mmetsp:Transcript_16619/g.63204  ORF Transcript_16619/g.63204 Transcript_16619/m.63204 type:complete len:329 (+) Transcript_16619:752-1738(+)